MTDRPGVWGGGGGVCGWEVGVGWVPTTPRQGLPPLVGCPPPLDKAHHPWWFWGGAAGRMPFVRYGYFDTIKCSGVVPPLLTARRVLPEVLPVKNSHTLGLRKYGSTFVRRYVYDIYE